MIFSSDQCENCLYGHIEEISKSSIYVTCDKHEGSRWFYGQFVNCDNDFKKKEVEENE